MTKSLIFQGILIFGGLIIIGLSINFWVALGVFLVVWGNNIQMTDNYKEYFIKALDKFINRLEKK